MKTMREYLRKTPIFPILKSIRMSIDDRIQFIRWILHGQPVPPARLAKRAYILKKIAEHPSEYFIETGTYLGDMVKMMLPHFQTIHSIEIEPTLFTNAKKQFENNSNIHIHLGDSATVLPTILSQLDKPAFFWLDGHYSGGITGKGDLETPIQRELESIARHPIHGHFILIDDARCFTGEHDYPTLTELQNALQKLRPDATFKVNLDMISIQL